LQKKCSIKNVLRCPYHSWSYNLEGKLVSTPHLGGMNKHESKDFDKSSSGLKEVRSVVWLDMIIINISKNEVPFENILNH
jgi:choline monooxygenase